MRASSGSTPKRLYGSAWQLARRGFLTERPVCAYCLKSGRTTAATVVDHIVPHKGDLGLFWDRSNWQALCKRCHDAIKQREEAGDVVGCDASGAPIDPRSHWHLPSSGAAAAQGEGGVETLAAHL